MVPSKVVARGRGLVMRLAERSEEENNKKTIERRVRWTRELR
jgi:hypothetical protein